MIKGSPNTNQSQRSGPNANQLARSGDWGRPNYHFGKEMESLGGDWSSPRQPFKKSNLRQGQSLSPFRKMK